MGDVRGPETTNPPASNDNPTIREFVKGIRFRPVILDALRGYDGAHFAQDAMAGLVVGLVALPLAIAFAIASGAEPANGLVTAAVAGIACAVLGGSRVQVSGPTGAFVVILFGIGAEHGLAKLLVAVLMAGAILFLMGIFQMGTLIKFIPYPVTTGFTAGIAVIIFLGQVPNLLGLGLERTGISVPADAIGKVEVIARHLTFIDGHALLLGVVTVLIIQLVKAKIPKVPGPIVAILLLTAAAYLLPSLASVETVGDRFTIPRGLPTPMVPTELSIATALEMLPAALTIAMLGAIESLLSAVVADGMTGQRHESNQELMGQGIANMLLPFFGGIAATGAIARTATNVQMGGRTPVAAVVHGFVVLGLLYFAAPFVAFVPMAVLGGILAVVAWNMSERHRFAQLLRMPAADAGVLLATFLLTVLVDLTVAVEVGMVLAAALFLLRMSRVTNVNVINPDTDQRYQQHSLEGKEIPEGVAVYSIDGPFFFGAADKFQNILGRVGREPKLVIFRMRHVPYLDATGLNALTTVVKQLQKHHVKVIVSGVQNQPLEMMMRSGFTRLVGDDNVAPNIDAALARARQVLATPPAPT